jgi:hypothetical protein
MLVSCWAQQMMLFGISYAAALVVLAICLRLVEDQQMHGSEDACLSASTQACGHVDLQHTTQMLVTQADACSHSGTVHCSRAKWVNALLQLKSSRQFSKFVCSTKTQTALNIKSCQNLSYAVTASAALQKAAQQHPYNSFLTSMSWTSLTPAGQSLMADMRFTAALLKEMGIFASLPYLQQYVKFSNDPSQCCSVQG